MICLRRPGGRWDAPAGLTFGAWADGGGLGPGWGPARDRRPTYDDLDYHLSTLFPPVRPRGHLEVRYLDAQPGDGWVLPTVLLAALTSERLVLDKVLEACEPAADRWLPAARIGLADDLVLRAAREVSRRLPFVRPARAGPGDRDPDRRPARRAAQPLEDIAMTLIDLGPEQLRSRVAEELRRARGRTGCSPTPSTTTT